MRSEVVLVQRVLALSCKLALAMVSHLQPVLGLLKPRSLVFIDMFIRCCATLIQFSCSLTYKGGEGTVQRQRS